MIKLFIDSDIILDLFSNREPFYKYSAKLFSLIDQNKVEGYTSVLVIANLHFLLKKMHSNSFALLSLRKLKTILKILSVDERIIEQSLNSEFNDFEDAIQYFAAVNNGINHIITRNTTDYKKSKIPVLTAEEFLKTWNAVVL